MTGNDPNVGIPSAGTQNRSGSTVGANSYIIMAPERSTRVGFTFENVSSNNITIRLGPTGPEYVIVPTGSFARNDKTGSVTRQAIYVKSAAGGDAFTFEEN